MGRPTRSAALGCLCAALLCATALGYGDGDEGVLSTSILDTLFSAVNCPSWADCPSSTNQPSQAAYAADECGPGFGYVPGPKPYKEDKYDDEDGDKYGKGYGKDDYYPDKPAGTCFPCRDGFYAPGGTGPCRACGPGEGFTTPDGAGSLSQCLCLPGYGGLDCKLCANGTFSAGGTLANPRPTCQKCPPNTQGAGPSATPGATSCGGCVAGFFLDEAPGICKICPANTQGSVAGGVGVQACGNCVARFWLDPSTGTCQACPANTAGGTVGGTGIAAACGPCAAGFWFDLSAGECVGCPYGSNSVAGSTSEKQCNICFSGYGIPDADSETACCGKCTLCPKGTYSNGGKCNKCPDGLSTNYNGATSSDACACLEPGFCVAPGPPPRCLKAPNGFFSRYNPDTGVNDCLPCGSSGPTGYTTFGGGASDYIQCGCAVGYGWDGSKCAQCVFPQYQGYLSPPDLVAGKPVTSATPQNPRPPCSWCLGEASSVGDVNKFCAGIGTPGAYCAAPEIRPVINPATCNSGSSQCYTKNLVFPCKGYTFPREGMEATGMGVVNSTRVEAELQA